MTVIKMNAPPRLYVVKEWIALAIVAAILVLLVVAVDRQRHEAARADDAELRADYAERRLRATEQRLDVCRDDVQRTATEISNLTAAVRTLAGEDQ